MVMWRGRPEGTDLGPVLACFRRTRRQVFGHRLFSGLLTGIALAAVFAVALAVLRASGRATPPPLLMIWLLVGLVPVLVGALAGLVGGRGPGVVADDVGLHRGAPGQCGFGPWSTIVDVRSQRRAGRTVVVLYLDSGSVLRLRAPYDGLLLSRDPDFEGKYFTLRNLWETHRIWRRPL